MKKLLILALSTFTIVACGAQDLAALIPDTQSTPRISNFMQAQTSTIVPTQTMTPTATLDHQATLVIVQQQVQNAQAEAARAQAEADAARRLMVDATVTHEYILLSQAQMTRDWELATVQADLQTQTAFATWIPVTQTKAAELVTTSAQQRLDQRTQLAATLVAPTLIVAVENSRVEAAYRETNEKITIGIKLAIIVFMLATTLFVILRIFQGARRSTPDDPFINPVKDPFMFAKETTDGALEYKLAIIPCRLTQLLDLADGIINQDMAFGFNKWQGTDVHKSLKDIRMFFEEHKFAKLIRGTGGELDLTAKGEQFLRVCLKDGAPPPPYTCLPD